MIFFHGSHQINAIVCSSVSLAFRAQFLLQFLFHLLPLNVFVILAIFKFSFACSRVFRIGIAYSFQPHAVFVFMCGMRLLYSRASAAIGVTMKFVGWGCFVCVHAVFVGVQTRPPGGSVERP